MIDKRLALAYMREAFATLAPEQKKLLREHAQKGTPICCGLKAIFYTDGEGGA